MALRPADLRYVAHLLSPDWILPAARALGGGDVVLGAEPAWAEVRAQLREYIRFVRLRDDRGASLELALALRAMGYAGRFQPVLALEDPWRPVAMDIFAGGRGETPGMTAPIPVHGLKASEVQNRVIAAVARMLQLRSDTNRAILDGRVWGRMSPEVMVNEESRKWSGPRSYVVRESDPAKVRSARSRARRALYQIEGHELQPVGRQLMRAWAKVGYIASPAGAMVSCAGLRGWPALAPFNGIPLAVQIGPIVTGSVTLYVAIDHRAFDGSVDERIYEALEEGVAA